MDGQLASARNVLKDQMRNTQSVLDAISDDDAFSVEERREVQELLQKQLQQDSHLSELTQRSEATAADTLAQRRSAVLDASMDAQAPEALIRVFRARQAELDRARINDGDEIRALVAEIMGTGTGGKW